MHRNQQPQDSSPIETDKTRSRGTGKRRVSAEVMFTTFNGQHPPQTYMYEIFPGQKNLNKQHRNKAQTIPPIYLTQPSQGKGEIDIELDVRIRYIGGTSWRDSFAYSPEDLLDEMHVCRIGGLPNEGVHMI